MPEPCVINVTSFDLSKTITFSKLFNKIKLSPTARLVIRALTDFWNPQKGLMFPGQKMLAECTGATERSVINAIEELRKKGIIVTIRTRSGLTYYFTKSFFDILELDKNQTQKFSVKKRSLCGRKNFTLERENFSHACHEQKREQKNKKSKIINLSSKEPKHLSIEKTKLQIKQKNKEQNLNFDNFSEKQAFEWCKNLPGFLRKKSKIYKKFVEKYNFSEKT